MDLGLLPLGSPCSKWSYCSFSIVCDLSPLDDWGPLDYDSSCTGYNSGWTRDFGDLRVEYY